MEENYSITYNAKGNLIRTGVDSTLLNFFVH